SFGMSEPEAAGVEEGDASVAVLIDEPPIAARGVRRASRSRASGGRPSRIRPAAAAGVCPFLIAATGDWRLAAPTRDHRCSAFVPLTSLSLEKQARLCLVAEHVTCATYTASVAARSERAGAAEPAERIGRWGIARTAPLIE